MDTFMFAALRVACAQLVRAAGFDNTSRNAINTLTDVVASCLSLCSCVTHAHASKKRREKNMINHILRSHTHTNTRMG